MAGKFTKIHNGITAFKTTSSGSGGSQAISVTTSTLASLISSNSIVVGQNYLITNADPDAYGGTTIMVVGTTVNSVSNQGQGIFYVPDYNNISVYDPINPPTLNIGDKVVWGNSVWEATQNSASVTVVGDLSLTGDISAVLLNSTDYIQVSNEVIYDLSNDHIVERKDDFGNKFSCSFEQHLLLQSLIGYANSKPISYFRFYSFGTQSIRDNEITGSFVNVINNFGTGTFDISGNEILASWLQTDNLAISCTSAILNNSLVYTASTIDIIGATCTNISYALAADTQLVLNGCDFRDTTLNLPVSGNGDALSITDSIVYNLEMNMATTGSTVNININRSRVKSVTFNTPTIDNFSIVNSNVESCEFDASTFSQTNIVQSTIENSVFIGSEFQDFVRCTMSGYNDSTGLLYNYPSGTAFIANGSNIDISFSIIFDGSTGGGEVGDVTLPCSAQIPAEYLARMSSVVSPVALTTTGASLIDCGISSLNSIQFFSELVSAINTTGVALNVAAPNGFTTGVSTVTLEVGVTDITAGQINVTVNLNR